MNPIFQQVSNQNPLEMLKMKAMNNPSYAAIVKLLENGSSPEQVFRSLCSQRGINPDQFLAGLNIK